MIVQEFEKTKNMGREIKFDLFKSGFIPNVTKSIWISVQIFEYLGVVSMP